MNGIKDINKAFKQITFYNKKYCFAKRLSTNFLYKHRKCIYMYLYTD